MEEIKKPIFSFMGWNFVWGNETARKDLERLKLCKRRLGRWWRKNSSYLLLLLCLLCCVTYCVNMEAPAKKKYLTVLKITKDRHTTIPEFMEKLQKELETISKDNIRSCHI